MPECKAGWKSVGEQVAVGQVFSRNERRATCPSPNDECFNLRTVGSIEARTYQNRGYRLYMQLANAQKLALSVVARRRRGAEILYG